MTSEIIGIIKEKDMKKALLSLLVVLLAGLLFVSCDNNATAVSDEPVSVSFATAMDRSLSAQVSYISFDQLDWEYQATLTSDTGFTYGQTVWAPINLSETREFSQGLWKFELRAKTRGENPQEVYYGFKDGVLIKKQSTPIPVLINVSPVSEGTGTISFGDISIIGKKEGETKTANKAVITGGNTSIDVALPCVKQVVPAGSYSVVVSCVNQYGTAEEYVVSASETIDVQVFSGADVRISGNIAEGTQSAILNPSLEVPETTFAKQLPVTITTVEGTVVVKVSETKEIKNDTLVVTYPVNTLLKDSNADSETKTADAVTGVKYVGDTLSNVSVDNNVSLQTNEGAVAQYQLTLNVADANNVYLTVKMSVEKNLAITRVLHNGVALYETTAAPEAGDTQKEYYSYNKDEGILTLYVFHASPIEIITAKPVTGDIIVTVNGVAKAFNVSDYEEEVASWNNGSYVDTANGWEISSAGGEFNADYIALCHAFWAASNGLGDVKTSIVLNKDLNTMGKYYSDIFRSDEEGTFTQYGHTAMKYYAEIPDVTLDLNGHKITMDATSQSGSAISVYNANLTIKDSVGGGGISSHCYSTLCHLGNTVITIEGGTFTTDAVNGSYHGMAIMSGGDYVENATANGYMPGQIVLKGGTFTFDYMDGNGGTKERPATVKDHYSSYPQRYEGYDENTPIGIFYYLEGGEIPEGYSYQDNHDGTFTVVAK